PHDWSRARLDRRCPRLRDRSTGDRDQRVNGRSARGQAMDNVRSTWRVVCGMLALAAVAARPLPGQAGRTSSDHAHTVPAARATPRHGAIAIDGRFDEPAWTTAAPITVF